jgi:hypothetical protein
MIRQCIRIGIGVLVALFISLPAPALAVSGTATTKWFGQALVSLTVTPNYYAGFGSVLATFGTQPAPTHGPAATGVGTGAVDFGPILAGDTYLYKYAASVNVTTTSSAGFFLYGEGAANFTNNTDSSTYAINQTLFYVPSTSGTVADSNTGYSAGYPFAKTGGLVAGGGLAGPPATITYTTYPSPIDASSSPSQDLYYDYLMKVPPAATSGQYYVWIVYTVVAQ